MDCLDCEADVIAFSVPADLREHLRGEESAVALCTSCLALHPAPEATPEPDAERALADVSDAFPTTEPRAMALVLGLLPSLAVYRAEIGALTRRLERAGVDVLLALDRFAADPALDPAVDLGRRRGQVAQLIE